MSVLGHVLRTSTVITGITSLHETLTGAIPNFMFLYAGLYCSYLNRQISHGLLACLAAIYLCLSIGVHFAMMA